MTLNGGCTNHTIPVLQMNPNGRSKTHQLVKVGCAIAMRVKGQIVAVTISFRLPNVTG